MKAILNNDKCFSTIKGHLASVFNTDGQDRDEISVDEARTAFDFTIGKYRSCTEDGRPIPKQFHLRRSDDDAIVPTRGLGDEFQPVQHSQVFDYICNDIMPQIPDMKLETVGTMHGGGTGVIMAKFGDDFRISGDKSPQQSRLFFFNPNGKSSLVVGFTTVRLFCQNQIRAAISSAGQSGFHIIHTTNADVRLDHAVETIYNQLGAVKSIQHREQRLAECKVGRRELENILNRLYPLNRFEEGSKGWIRMKNQRDAIAYQFTEGETAQEMEFDTGWKLYNSITYVSHNPKRVGATTDIAQIQYSNTVGSRADRNLKVLEMVERECGVAA